MAQIVKDYQLYKLLDANVTANTVSDSLNVARYAQLAIQFVSAGLGTLLVEGSLDDVNYVTIDATQDPGTIIQITDRYNWLRVTRDDQEDEVTVLVAGYTPDWD